MVIHESIFYRLASDVFSLFFLFRMKLLVAFLRSGVDVHDFFSKHLSNRHKRASQTLY